MSIILSDIAAYPTLPNEYSLSCDANFLEIVPSETPDNSHLVSFGIEIIQSTPLPDNVSFAIQEESGDIHTFKGSTNANDVNSFTFFIATDAATTAANFANCLRNDQYVGGNYFIELMYRKQGDKIVLANTISIRNKPYFNLLKIGDYSKDLFKITGKVPSSVNRDSILGSDEVCTIHVDYYSSVNTISESDTPLAIGQPTLRTDSNYIGGNTWFNINDVATHLINYKDLIDASNWFDPGTYIKFNYAVIKSNKTSTTPLYISDTLTVVKGYKNNLNNTDLSSYVYKSGKSNFILPLKASLATIHTIGQPQFYNFLLENTINEVFNASIRYVLYSNSGKKLTYTDAHEVSSNDLSTVNSIRLDLDSIIEDYPTTAKVEVYLLVNGQISSIADVYTIVPNCKESKSVVFLNCMGGWSSINLTSETDTESKLTPSNYGLTLTPNYRSNEGNVRTLATALETIYTIQSKPLNSIDLTLFKEMYQSYAIYEADTLQRIIVQSTTIKTKSTDQLTVVELKYKYANENN